MKMISAFLTVCGLVAAQAPQAPNPVQQPTENAARMAAGAVPIYRATVTARTTKAINYQHRSGATKIDFRGTELLPDARGEAKVESKQGYIEIEVEFDGLQPAIRNGAEYLTYVLWAITPEGRTANLGEILLNGTKSKLDVTTELQVFGLVVTAEPYYAVTRPSDLVVMENVVRADRFAVETFQKAEKSLAQAETYQADKTGKKSVTMASREAVQIAEDSRAIAVKRQEDEALTAERQQSVEREARAQSERDIAQSETDRVTRDAEAARIKAQAEYERLTRERDAQAASARADADRLKLDSDARMAAASTEADRLKLENDARASAAASEADRLRRENEAQRAASQTELDSAARQKAQLEAEKAELRIQLLNQFNAVLQTRDTARGLIVNMSDVLFDTGKYSLRPAAREKLAKVAGIVSGHPGLRLEVEGHTDSVGGDEYNQQLSEQRANAVRDYLTQQGMVASSVTARGFGETQPVASNDNANGRQQNRRVELVISGEVIGTPITAK